MFRTFKFVFLIFFSAYSYASTQLILVQTLKPSSFVGQLQRYERENEKAEWRAIGRAVPVVMGKNGLTPHGVIKREGDGSTPSGIYSIGTLFGFDKRASFKTDYLPLTATSVCVDDPKSRYYNQIIDTARISKPDWMSAEAMRTISLYRWGGVIQYNLQQIKGAGSCIFLHVWRSPKLGTAGCVAMKKSDLLELLQWLDSAKKPVIAIYPKDYIQKLKLQSKLT